MPKKYTRYSKNICTTVTLFVRKYSSFEEIN